VARPSSAADGLAASSGGVNIARYAAPAYSRPPRAVRRGDHDGGDVGLRRAAATGSDTASPWPRTLSLDVLAGSPPLRPLEVWRGTSSLARGSRRPLRPRPRSSSMPPPSSQRFFKRWRARRSPYRRGLPQLGSAGPLRTTPSCAAVGFGIGLMPRGGRCPPAIPAPLPVAPPAITAT
jgi:hypothetical protein